MPEPPELSERVGTVWGLEIGHTWDGTLVGSDETVAVMMRRERDVLAVGVDAPFHDDSRPTSDDLWRHEVTEVMLVGA